MNLSFLHRKVIRIQGDHSTTLGIMRERLIMLGVFFAVCFLGVSMRVVDLGVLQGYMARQYQVADNSGVIEGETGAVAKVRRGYVYDRNGVVLATSVKVPSLFADPSLILEPELVAAQLGKIFPELNVAKTAEAMKGNNSYASLVRPVTPEQQARVLELGQPGLAFEYKYDRVYPQGALTGHLVGYSSIDGNGLAGIEMGRDDILAKGGDVYVSVDVRLQHVLKRELQKAVEEFRAIGAVGAILDIKTGEVLAGVSLPDFDPNYLSRYEKKKGEENEKFNKLTLGVYELGSVFKVFSIAAYLDFQSGSLGKKFDVSEPLKIGRFRLNDYHPMKRSLTIPEIFIHSSNIGTALMAEELGADKLKRFYKDLGLLDRMKTELVGSGAPIVPEKWPRSTLLTVSYGHGLSTTPLQVVTALASVVNDGISIRPTFLKAADDFEKEEVRILSEGTSSKMRKMLRLNAIHGTGKSADVEGFFVGGKTGTADKYHNKERVSSFAGVFPAHDPRYAMIITVDEPKGHKGSYGFATAGWVAAPVFSRVVTSMASILGLEPEASASAETYGEDILHHISPEDRKVVKKKGAQLVSY